MVSARTRIGFKMDGINVGKSNLSRSMCKNKQVDPRLRRIEKSLDDIVGMREGAFASTSSYLGTSFRLLTDLLGCYLLLGGHLPYECPVLRPNAGRHTDGSKWKHPYDFQNCSEVIS